MPLMVEMVELNLFIGQAIQIPSISTVISVQAIDRHSKVTCARNVLALSSVLEVLKVEAQNVHGVLNQV